jgi:hypothetical protein
VVKSTAMAWPIQLSIFSPPPSLLLTKPPANRAGNRAEEPSGANPDGTMVYFVCFEEQLAAVPAGAKVHGVGHRLKRTA